MKVLLLENIHPVAAEAFRRAGFEVDVRAGSLSEDELIDQLWPDTHLTDTRTLDTHIHRLRAKLEPDPSEPRYIVTVRGVGFRVDPEGVADEPVGV